MLHGQLVCGCKDQHLQCKLLAESGLTFKKVFKVIEVTESYTFHGSSSIGESDQVNLQKNSESST